MQKITPFLWFDHQAEAAARFYTSIFKHSKIVSVTRYGAAGPGPKGRVMTVEFQLDGQGFVALNGGPLFKFNEAISLVVNCRNQQEVDRMWTRLSAGGTKESCGWLKDKYGVSWQVVPTVLVELLKGGAPEVLLRVMRAMMKMKKLDIVALKRAAKGR